MTELTPYHCPNCNRVVGLICDEGLRVNDNSLIIKSVVRLKCLFCNRLMTFRPSKPKTDTVANLTAQQSR